MCSATHFGLSQICTNTHQRHPVSARKISHYGWISALDAHSSVPGQLRLHLLADEIKITPAEPGGFQCINRGDVLHEPDAWLQRLHRLQCLPDHTANYIIESKSCPCPGPRPSRETTDIYVHALWNLIIFFVGSAEVGAISKVPRHVVITHVDRIVVRFSETPAGMVNLAIANKASDSQGTRSSVPGCE